MVGEDKKDMDFFSYIKNNKALIPVFFSGILTYEVFDHFFSEGMRPGAGAEGDITGFIAPIFIVISASVLAFSLSQDNRKMIRIHVYNMIIELLAIFFGGRLLDNSCFGKYNPLCC